jgi:aminocarboxymuconate-semialdehyde decarboxylase
MSIHAARSIDIHAHAVLEECFGAAGAYGPELTTAEDGRPLFRVGDYKLHGVRYRNSPFMDPELRLAAMDKAGIDFQVLSPNPLTYFHFIEPQFAANFCRRHNEALARVVARYPERLGGFAALPMQDVALAAEELRFAVDTLGLWGGYIGTEFGMRLDSPRLDPFYDLCTTLDVPLFLHPAPAGIDGPPAFPSLEGYDLDLLTGFAASETLASATLIFGGVLDRHPRLDVCLSHGGGSVAFLAGRLSAAARQRPWSQGALREPGAFESRLARLWFDNHVNDPASLDLLQQRVGSDRLVLGTNFAGWDQPVVAHSSGSKLQSDSKSVSLADNARRLLRQSSLPRS